MSDGNNNQVDENLAERSQTALAKANDLAIRLRRLADQLAVATNAQVFPDQTIYGNRDRTIGAQAFLRKWSQIGDEQRREGSIRIHTFGQNVEQSCTGR